MLRQSNLHSVHRRPERFACVQTKGYDSYCLSRYKILVPLSGKTTMVW